MNSLNLALAFRRNGLNDKAEAMLRQILDEYPNAGAAEEARRLLTEIENEKGKAEGGRPPPVKAPDK